MAQLAPGCGPQGGGAAADCGGLGAEAAGGDLNAEGIFSIWSAGKPVSVATIRVNRAAAQARLGYIATASEHRRRGYASACLNYAKPLRPNPLALDTEPFRQPAIRLYEKFGFRKVREERQYTRAL